MPIARDRGPAGCEAPAWSGSAHALEWEGPQSAHRDGKYLVQPQCLQVHTHASESPRSGLGIRAPPQAASLGPRDPCWMSGFAEDWGKGQTGMAGLGSARARECAVRSEWVRVCVTVKSLITSPPTRRTAASVPERTWASRRLGGHLRQEEACGQCSTESERSAPRQGSSPGGHPPTVSVSPGTAEVRRKETPR